MRLYMYYPHFLFAWSPSHLTPLVASLVDVFGVRTFPGGVVISMDPVYSIHVGAEAANPGEYSVSY
jgi:hypothetical protein